LSIFKFLLKDKANDKFDDNINVNIIDKMTIDKTSISIDVYDNNKCKNDFIFTDDGVYVHVKNGKCGISRDVKLIDSSYLENKLPDYLGYFNDNENIFYSSNYMKVKAQDFNFRCHDLRRTSAKIVFNQFTSKDNETSIEAVKNHLGHSPKTRTYKKYLSRKVNFTNTKWIINKELSLH